MAGSCRAGKQCQDTQPSVSLMMSMSDCCAVVIKHACIRKKQKETNSKALGLGVAAPRSLKRTPGSFAVHVVIKSTGRFESAAAFSHARNP